MISKLYCTDFGPHCVLHICGLGTQQPNPKFELNSPIPLSAPLSYTTYTSKVTFLWNVCHRVMVNELNLQTGKYTFLVILNSWNYSELQLPTSWRVTAHKKFTLSLWLNKNIFNIYLSPKLKIPYPNPTPKNTTIYKGWVEKCYSISESIFELI